MDRDNRDLLKTRKVVNDGLQDSELAKASDHLSQRRKLIKASTAVVPALMTLRSGAAAALTSSAHRCLNNPNTDLVTGTLETGGTTDPFVLGDEINELTAEGLPNDQLVRVAAKPAKYLTFTYTPGHSDNERTVTYYFIRKTQEPFPWTNLDDWHIYNQDGYLLNDKQREKLPETKPELIEAWDKEAAIMFYGVESVHSPGSLNLVEESNATLAVPVPVGVTIDMMNSPILVYLAAYYTEVNGVITMTYYPMPQGDALLINGSCLTSIAPKFQML